MSSSVGKGDSLGVSRDVSLVLKKNEGKLIAALKKCPLEDLCHKLRQAGLLSPIVEGRFLSLDYDHLEEELMVRYLLQNVYERLNDHRLDLFISVISTFNEIVAGELRKEVSFQTMSEAGSTGDPVSEKQHVNSEGHVVYQSGNTSGAYGKATLIGFLTTTTESVKYQWRRNDQPLNNEMNVGCGYSGTQSTVLYISCVCGPTEGLYDCQVHSDSGELLQCSEKITLTVYRSEISKKFSLMYSKWSEVPRDTWPPMTNTKYINLALINKNRKVNREFEYAVQGDMDDIIASKESIKYTDSFGRYKSGSILLVEGCPGSGKTTLMHKLSIDWAVNKNILLGAEIVILVPLRLLCNTSSKDLTLSRIFELYLEGDSIRSKFLENVEELNGEGLCFIIDSLDEYEYSGDRNRLIYKLIHKQIMHLSMVIVASRPVGTASIRNSVLVTKRIEVLGFQNDQIIEYVKSYFESSQDIAQKLLSYLRLHINVLHMCYLPVHAAMICFLYSKLGGNIPETETKIYQAFTIYTLLRYTSRDVSEPVRINLWSLPKHINDYFNRICSLAFDMIIQSKQVVLQFQTQFPLSFPGSDKSSLGLVTIDSIAGLFGIEDLYSFFHLTFQQYLAAFYLTGLDEEQVISKTKGKQTSLQMVWKFYCGMVAFNEDSIVLKYILSNTDRHSLLKFQYGFESQQQIVCDGVVESDKTDTLSFYDCILTPYDFLAISYVISSTSYKITSIVFSDSMMSEEGIVLFTKKLISGHLDNIKSLSYHNRHCTVVQCEILNVLLRQGLKCCTNLQTLILSGNNISTDGTVALADGLKYCIHLKTLDLYNNSIGSGHVTALAEVLKYCINIRKLNLGRNSISLDSTVALVEGLKYCTSLQKLNLSRNCMGSDGAVAVAEGLKFCTNLQKLNFIGNGIGSDGAVALAEGLKHCTNLQRLYLRDNGIGLDGIEALAELMKYCHSLKLFPRKLRVN